ncbi:hypothetical protein WME89_19435 [Sorangium sp. So ce321]|uniref:hypothetical protein n=1 Tax=Sorangium sp. So ce321 TaxID=3133300 RepID=UPI003F5E6E8B
MDGQTAMAFAADEFEKRHPRDTWPEWVRPCTSISYSRDQRGHYVVSFAVSMEEPLGAHEHWEEQDGEKYIVRVDPSTSERFRVFRTPSRTEVYFQVDVDPDTAEVVALQDSDLLDIDGRNLMRAKRIAMN